MAITLIGVLVILASHWVGDFLLQTDQQALNKSKSNFWLAAHVTVYTIAVTSLLALYNIHTQQYWKDSVIWAKFAGITFAAHFVTDYITSRVNAKLWKANKLHQFFVSVGLDQLLHYTQLLLTLHFIT